MSLQPIMCQRKYLLCSLVVFVLVSVASSDDSTSTSFSPLSIIITTSSATGTRYIQPPWPWVVGHLTFSIGLAIYGLVSAGPRRLGETIVRLLVRLLFQYLNFFISLGAIIVLFRRLTTGNISLPGLGVAIELATLMIYNGYDKSQNEQSRASRVLYKLFWFASALLCIIGTVLYIVVGGLAVSKGSSNSVLLIVNTGCDAVCWNEYTDWHLYQSVGGDEIRLFAWGVSAGILGVVVLVVNSCVHLYLSCRHCTMVFPHPVATKFYTAFLIVAAGPLAIAAAIQDRKAAEGTFADCTGAVRISTEDIFQVMVYTPCVYTVIGFPGSASGFWELWVRSKIAVLEGLVVW
jgi:hypothetical protein